MRFANAGYELIRASTPALERGCNMQFDDVVRGRRSVRAFRSDPVPAELIRELLQTACMAPSGTNIQPWKVHVVTGDTRQRLEEEVLAHRETRPDDDKAEFARSSKRKEPYISRMRALGKDMYGRIGIPRGDEVSCCRFRGHRVKVFYGTGGYECNDASSAASSSSRR